MKETERKGEKKGRKGGVEVIGEATGKAIRD
jgi:hypothetical protein